MIYLFTYLLQLSMLAVSLEFCSNSPLFENFFVIVTHPKLKILMPKRCPKNAKFTGSCKTYVNNN